MSLPARAFDTAEVDEIHELALPLDDAVDFDALLERVGDAASSSWVRRPTGPPTITAGEPSSPGG